MFDLLQGFYRDIRNWNHLSKVIRKNIHTERWKYFNLRADWINRIYTVVSLRKEDMGEPELIQSARIIERMKPINSYIEAFGVAEFVMPSVDYIPSEVEGELSTSWLVVYRPVFHYITFRNLLKVALQGSACLAAFGFLYLLFRILFLNGGWQAFITWIDQLTQ